jgi:hypothetical protein
MIKSELVQRIAEHNPHLYQRDVENIVNAILDEIVAAWRAATGSNCAVSARSRSSIVRAARAQSAHRRACAGRSEERPVSSRRARKCANG